MPRSLWIALGVLAAGHLSAEPSAGQDRLDTIEVGAERRAEAPMRPTLEEIVVTAQKRAASLQDTPISITTFDAGEIERRGIEGVHDLGEHVPGLTLEVFPTHQATLRVYIRGVGVHDAQLTQDPAVGLYIDGVYVARSVGLALEVLDLERIEVLRGPQGTLYGRNTTGGAINLITRKPSTEAFEMSHSLGVGSRGRLRARSSFNLPLGEHLAARVSALGSQRDGQVRNTGPGDNFGDREARAFRFDLRWAGDTGLSANYGFDWSGLDYVNELHQSIRLPETNKGDAELIKPFAVSRTVYSGERLEALSATPPHEPSSSLIRGHTLTLDAPFAWGAGDGALRYIGAHRELTDVQYAELGGGLGSPDYRIDTHAYDGPAADEANGGPTPLVIPVVTQTQRSHELQLSGDWAERGLRFVAGAYHFAEDGVEDRHQLNHQFSSGIAPEQINQFGLGDLVAQTNNGRLVQFVDLWWSIRNRAWAAYGEFSWAPEWRDRRLELSAGYRHSEDRRAAVKYRTADTYVESIAPDGSGTAELLSSGEFFDDVPASREFSDDSFSFTARYALGASSGLYAKAVEGYKSGGFNVRDPHVNGQSEDAAEYGFGFQEGFDAEQVITYELGLKSEWRERTLRLNAALFHTDYSDMQINFLLPGTIFDTKTRNAGKARVRGLEIDLRWLLGDAVSITADYALLDARVLEAIDVNGDNVASLYPFPSAPRHSGAVTVDTRLARVGAAQLQGFLAFTFTGWRQGVVITEERRGLNRIPSTGLINARLALVGFPVSGGAIDVSLWGRNLADRAYPIVAIDNVPHSDRAVVWGEARALGLDLSYRFR